MAHVFISYVLQNRDLVDKLANELRNRGVVVWLDRNSIEPGSRWRDAIKKAIRGGKCFMACFSKEYNEREKTYMNEELTTAIDELRERSSDKAWFIPVLINEAPIPSRRISAVEDLSDLQAVRLYEDWDTGINRIFRALSYDDPALVRVWQLVDIAEGPFGDERFRAIEQLGMIRPVMKPAILCLIKAIQGHNDVQIRRAALTALLYMGEEAAEAAAAVRRCAQRPRKNHPILCLCRAAADRAGCRAGSHRRSQRSRPNCTGHGRLGTRKEYNPNG